MWPQKHSFTWPPELWYGLCAHQLDRAVAGAQEVGLRVLPCLVAQPLKGRERVLSCCPSQLWLVCCQRRVRLGGYSARMVVNWLLPMHGKSQSACLTCGSSAAVQRRVDSDDWGPTFLLAKKCLLQQQMLSPFPTTSSLYRLLIIQIMNSFSFKLRKTVLSYSLSKRGHSISSKATPYVD